MTHERFVAWLRTSPEHVRAYLGILALWTDLPALEASSMPDAETLIANARAAPPNVVSWGAAPADTGTRVRLGPSPTQALSSRIGRWAIAASVVGVMGAFLGWQIWQGSKIVATDIGEERSLSLPDGSQVELNSQSKIRIRFSDEERAIDLLTGQAIFQVAKESTRPFIVHSPDAVVRAVGTQFDVYRKEAGTTITVVEGAVSIQPRSEGTPALLTAGEQAVVSPRAAAQKQRVDIAAATAWTRHQLIFRATPLSVVVEEFNRYNTHRLALVGTVDNFPVTAVFSTTNPATLLEFLKAQPGITVHLEGEVTRIVATTGVFAAHEK